MAEDGFRNTAYGMGFEAGLDALRDVIGAAQALVADLEGAENAWQGVGVLAVEIRKLVELRVALRDAGYVKNSNKHSHSLVLESGALQSEAETGNGCTGIHAGHAGRWMCGVGFGPLCDDDGGEREQAYSPWLVDGRKPTIADYMASVGVRA